jgi:hypothetical protein
MGRQQITDDLYERHFTDEQLDDLLAVAKIDLSNDAARQMLKRCLLGTPHPQAKARSSSSVRSVPIKKVEDLADALMKQITALRLEPHSHSDFWLSDVFGPVHNDAFEQTIAQFERPRILEAVQTIAQAARDAQKDENGRPPLHRKQRTIDIAALFFQEFSPKKFSGTPGKEFYLFAEAFYSIAQGRDPGKDEPKIDRQVKVAVANMKQKLNKTPLNS